MTIKIATSYVYGGQTGIDIRDVPSRMMLYMESEFLLYTILIPAAQNLFNGLLYHPSKEKLQYL